jgi:hypothetical protein
MREAPAFPPVDAKLLDEVVALTPFAVEARYDFEFWPDRVEAETAVAMAERACAAIAVILGK